MSEQTDDYGVLLVNMGGPGSETEIVPYLYRLFSDPLILNLPGILRKGVAALIAKLRRKKAVAKYALIGGKSPLADETSKQVQKLSEILNVPVRYAMRYTNPSIQDSSLELANLGVKRLVVLPLYPQYSKATTQSVWNYLDRHKDRLLPFLFVRHHYHHLLYIRALSNLLNQALEQLDLQYKTATVFVAHSLPLKQVKSGDPYVNQVEETVSLVIRESALQLPYYLAYQSRVGPVKWQGPSLEEVLQMLVDQQIQQLLVHPLSFVSENLETLYDLDIQFKNKCKKAGIKNYIRVPVPGIHPLYIDALASLIKEQIGNR